MSEITCVIRVHSATCFAMLERALLSLTAQKIDLEIVLVTQNFSKSFTENLESLTASYQFGAIKRVNFVNVRGAGDLRSKLLNVAIQTVQTRYLHFLDYDDIMYEHAYRDVVGVLKRSNAAIAFGGIVSSFYELVQGAPYILKKRKEFIGKSRYDLFVDNFCPLHSYVIDLERCKREDINFDEDMSTLEDYSFLIEFVAKYPSDFSIIEKPIGEYFRRIDDTVSASRKVYPDAARKISALDYAREKISEKRRVLFTKVALTEFNWLLGVGDSRASGFINSLGGEENSNVLRMEGGTARTTYMLGKFLHRRFVAIDRSKKLTGLIDFLTYKRGTTLVEGWFDDSESTSGIPAVIGVSYDGLTISEAIRFDREDVRNALNKTYENFGFQITVPFNISSPEDFIVVALSAEGQIICRVDYGDFLTFK